MPNVLVADASSLIALERRNLVKAIPQLKEQCVIPLAVKEELWPGTKPEIFIVVKVYELTKRTLKKSHRNKNLGSFLKIWWANRRIKPSIKRFGYC